MHENEFGFYILTCPRDYHLALVLINSLKYFHPEIPLAIVPGTGMNLNDHPFKDIPILKSKNNFFRSLNYYDKKFEIFDGPFEKFLYLDSDLLCVKSINKLINEIINENDRFIYTNLIPDEIELIISETKNKNREIINSGQLGKQENIKLFDGNFDFYNFPNFNTGLFATSKKSYPIDEIVEFFKNENEFYQTVLKKDYSGANFDLFFGDQGKLNYLTWKHRIPLKSLYDSGNFILGSEKFNINYDEMFEGKNNFHFIHWAGCPRPSNSLFCKGVLFKLFFKAYSINFNHLKYNLSSNDSIPGYYLWQFFNNDKSFKSKLKFTYMDFVKTVKYFFELPVRKQLKKVKKYFLKNYSKMKYEDNSVL